ncbi:hypothetical protein C8F04DRAFT_1255931 [Mycena alexandri]|uniref:Uncharacterized protein n=1 Tax=Mycena alexandri TaxID=1745969 RepID=A0AAD6T2R9_9AGAR|nr:hypothetical protein C8F04DRAFT_1255931 [Mycena alexandri]
MIRLKPFLHTTTTATKTAPAVLHIHPGFSHPSSPSTSHGPLSLAPMESVVLPRATQTTRQAASRGRLLLRLNINPSTRLTTGPLRQSPATAFPLCPIPKAVTYAAVSSPSPRYAHGPQRYLDGSAFWSLSCFLCTSPRSFRFVLFLPCCASMEALKNKGMGETRRCHPTMVISGRFPCRRRNNLGELPPQSSTACGDVTRRVYRVLVFDMLVAVSPSLPYASCLSGFPLPTYGDSALPPPLSPAAHDVMMSRRFLGLSWNPMAQRAPPTLEDAEKIHRSLKWMGSHTMVPRVAHFFLWAPRLSWSAPADVEAADNYSAGGDFRGWAPSWRFLRVVQIYRGGARGYNCLTALDGSGQNNMWTIPSVELHQPTPKLKATDPSADPY